MDNRKQSVSQLLEEFGAIKRSLAFSAVRLGSLPRITPSQWTVLMLVEERPDCSVKTIAQTLKITSSATTQLINGLVRSGYLQRTSHTTDRRAVQLQLSALTKNHIRRLKAHMLTKMVQLFSALTDAELAQYAKLNKKIAARLTKSTK